MNESRVSSDESSSSWSSFWCFLSIFALSLSTESEINLTYRALRCIACLSDHQNVSNFYSKVLYASLRSFLPVDVASWRLTRRVADRRQDPDTKFSWRQKLIVSLQGSVWMETSPLCQTHSWVQSSCSKWPQSRDSTLCHWRLSLSCPLLGCARGSWCWTAQSRFLYSSWWPLDWNSPQSSRRSDSGRPLWSRIWTWWWEVASFHLGSPWNNGPCEYIGRLRSLALSTPSARPSCHEGCRSTWSTSIACLSNFAWEHGLYAYVTLLLTQSWGVGWLSRIPWWTLGSALSIGSARWWPSRDLTHFESVVAEEASQPECDSALKSSAGLIDHDWRRSFRSLARPFLWQHKCSSKLWVLAGWNHQKSFSTVRSLF